MLDASQPNRAGQVHRIGAWYFSASNPGPVRCKYCGPGPSRHDVTTLMANRFKTLNDFGKDV
jgi:hypothetical protein